jgi:hypothetical protein
MSLRRTDHSSRGVLLNVARRCVCDQETSKTRKIQQWVVTPGKQKTNSSQVGRDSSVGTATRYVLDDVSIESGDIFRIRPDRSWGPPSLLYNGHRFAFPGVKRPGRGVDHPFYISPRLKNEYSYTSVLG